MNKVDSKQIEQSNQFLPQFEKRNRLFPVVVQEYDSG